MSFQSIQGYSCACASSIPCSVWGVTERVAWTQGHGIASSMRVTLQGKKSSVIVTALSPEAWGNAVLCLRMLSSASRALPCDALLLSSQKQNTATLSEDTSGPRTDFCCLALALHCVPWSRWQLSAHLCQHILLSARLPTCHQLHAPLQLCSQAFYMRLNPDDKTVAAMDLLVPRVGELIGGSQREERLQV